MEALFRLWHVLLLMNKRNDHQYVVDIGVQLLIIMHQHEQELPQWDMLREQGNLFNEETGEITFSVLARCVVGDTTKSKFDHINKLYRLIHTYQGVDADIKSDAHHGEDLNWRHTVTEDSVEAQSTVEFFRLMVRRIRTNQFQEYDGSKKSFKNSAHAAACMQRRKETTPLADTSRDAEELATEALKKGKNKYEGQMWGLKVQSIWPEFKHKRPEELKDMTLFSEEEEDDEEAEIQAIEDSHKEQHGIGSILRRPSTMHDDDEYANYMDNMEDPESDIDENAQLEPPRKKANIGTMDENERGEAVTWSEFGSVSQGNITNARRSERQARNVRDVSAYMPMVQNY
jgi:hypothetical protein